MNDPPPGTDEVVAMTQIVKFLEEGIVLPNGDQMVSILFLNHTYNCAVHYIYLHSFTSFLLRTSGYCTICLSLEVDHFTEQHALESNQSSKILHTSFFTKDPFIVLTVSCTHHSLSAGTLLTIFPLFYCLAQLFDRIVLDTAPTGHTLRMLQLPDFLQALMGKMKKIRTKAGGIGDMLGGMRGGAKSDLEAADEDKLDKFEKRMERLEEILHNPKESEFTVVTIATEVASAETVRLLQSLKDESIAVRRLIINQVLPTTTDATASVETTDLATNAYLDRLRSGQKSSIRELESLAQRTNSNLVQIPYFDMEVRTVYGLRVVGNAIFKEPK